MMNLSRNTVDAAKRYAAAERSDPFAFRRAISHARNGVGMVTDKQGRQRLAYDALPFSEGRAFRRPDGSVVKFNVHGYRLIAS